uniref:Guanylate-binding protein 1-like n=1 Tax=Erpetoichthys calabaricus TaxID=27687 RepID=A0A8C4TCM7_ERPCA
MAFVPMKAPVCLIENTESNELHVNQGALEILQAIQQPVVVVAIVGLYRTGKSFLMNKLAGKHTGFPLGSSIQSETKGIWMWCVPHPNKPNHTLVLLDTEGLGDVEKGDQKNDNWIFALAVLFSSILVYNSMGTINNEAVQSLQYVTEMSKYIKVKSEKKDSDDSAEFARFFPSFVWAVRDFTLELVLNGKPIKPDEYLENSLKLKQVAGNSKGIESYNLPRLCIRSYFPTRRCFVFERPASASKMRKMETLTDADLDPDFVSQTQDFCRYILDKNGRAKIIKGGFTMTGQMLGTLIPIYVDTIRSGSVPCLDNAISALAQIQNTAAVQCAISHYKEQMEKMTAELFESQKNLSDVHGHCEREAIKVFMSKSFKDDDQLFQEELGNSLKKEYESYCLKQEDRSREYCLSLLKEFCKDVEAKIKNGVYMKPGGYQDYRSDLQHIVKKYGESPKKGMKADIVLLEFLKEKEEIGGSILKADNAMTEQEKQIQMEQVKKESMEREASAAREAQRALEQRLVDQEKAHQEHMNQYMEKMEQERQAAMEEQSRLIDSKLREQKEFLQEGFNQRAADLNRQIEELKKRKPPSGPRCVVM